MFCIKFNRVAILPQYVTGKSYRMNGWSEFYGILSTQIAANLWRKCSLKLKLKLKPTACIKILAPI